MCRQSYWQFTHSMSALNMCLSPESPVTGIPVTWSNVFHSLVKNKTESANTLKNSPMNFDWLLKIRTSRHEFTLTRKWFFLGHFLTGCWDRNGRQRMKSEFVNSFHSIRSFSFPPRLTLPFKYSLSLKNRHRQRPQRIFSSSYIHLSLT